MLYTECHSWLWPRNPKSTGFLLSSSTIYIWSLKVIEQTAVAIMSTRSYTQSATIDLDLWPRDPKSIGFLLSSLSTCMWSLKVIGQNCSLYRVFKVLCTECHSWPWPLTPVPEINRFPPLIHNLHVKFESDMAKTAECHSWPWPLILGQKCHFSLYNQPKTENIYKTLFLPVFQNTTNIRDMYLYNTQFV